MIRTTFNELQRLSYNNPKSLDDAKNQLKKLLKMKLKIILKLFLKLIQIILQKFVLVLIGYFDLKL